MAHQEHREHDTLDTIDEQVLKGELFFERHGKKIIIAVAALLVIALGFFAYHRFVTIPKSEKATAQMFVAEDSFMLGQDSLALKGQGAGSQGFEAIAKNFSGTDAANLAHAYSGICLYDMGKYQEALTELKKFSSDEAVVAPSIQRIIGDCYVQLGKLDDAVKAYETAAKQVYEKQGKYDKAIALYNEVKTKYYTAPEAETVEADLLRAQAAQGK